MDNKLNRYLEKRSIFEIITGIFIIAVLAIFPLFYTNYYFNILQAKYYFYCIAVISLLVIMFFCILYQYIVKGNIRIDLKTFLGIWTVPDIFMIVFLCINIISTLLSDYVYESFWGNEGRYTGLFLWLLYGCSFFVIEKFFKLKKGYIDIFLAAGLLACLFGITDYFQMDLLGFKKDIHPDQINMFASTIGNVNTYTSYVALVMGVSAALYGTSKGWLRTIWYYICMMISFFAIIMGLSDNAYLALGTLFAFLPLYLFRTRTGIRRYGLMLATFSGVIWCVDFINKALPDTVLEMSGLLRSVSGYNKLEIIVVILFVLSMVIYIIDYLHKEKDEHVGRWLTQAWLSAIICVVTIVAFILYDANIAGNAERYGGLSNYLIFNDDWGTHRGYNWRIALEEYKGFSLKHKIFGYGPDTYGILCIYGNHYEEMKQLYNEVFDSVHNEYLQFWVTVGPFGMLAYIGILLSSGFRIVKNAFHNEYAMAALFAVICYAVQAVVNISIPIATPIMLTLLMMGLSACKDKKEI